MFFIKKITVYVPALKFMGEVKVAIKSKKLLVRAKVTLK